jgi:DNA processing protein
MNTITDNTTDLLNEMNIPVNQHEFALTAIAKEMQWRTPQPEPDTSHDGLLAHWHTATVDALKKAIACDAKLMLVTAAHNLSWRLGRIYNAMPVDAIWVRGDVTALNGYHTPVALVGARAATGYGEHLAMEFAASLAARAVTVISGGAYGIDGAAHRAVLACGGSTVAVLAGGVDRMYPQGHEALLQRIIDTPECAVVSTVPPGTMPTKQLFLNKSRVVAAMADAVVVIEAGRHSGSLNVYRQALAIDVQVGAVPGPVTSAASSATNAMLGTPGVRTICNAQDILEMIGK